jgi:hypothetical protein
MSIEAHMSIISYPSEPAPHESDLVVEPERPGIFAFIMSAMHSSRRHQASRILRQYEPLIERKLRGHRMLVNKPAQAKLTVRSPTRAEMGWLVAVAVAFLVVHIVTGTTWMRASAAEVTPVGYEPISLLCD